MELQNFYDSLKAVSVLENPFEMFGLSFLTTILLAIIFFAIVPLSLYGIVTLYNCFINKSLINTKVMTDTNNTPSSEVSDKRYFWLLFVVIPILSLFIYSHNLTIKQYSYVTYDDILKSPSYNSLSLAEKDFINYQLENIVKKKFAKSETIDKVSLYEIKEIIKNTSNIESLLPKYQKMIELETLLNNKNKG